MDLPSGEKIEQGIVLKTLKLEKTLTDLAQTKFSGYLALTIDSSTGIEEGAVLFREGKIIAAVYEYGQVKLIHYGETAFQEFMNALHAPHGVLDIYQLSKQQAELIVAFNEKMKAEHEVKDLKNLLAAKFSNQYSQQALIQAPGAYQSKIAVMKKLGLLDIER